MKKTLIFVLLVIIILWAPMIKAQEISRNRDEIPAEFKWNLNDIFPNWQAWEAALSSLEQKMSEITALKGTLGKDAESLLHALKLQDELGILSFRVFRYPQFTWDTDTRNQEAAGRLQKVRILFAGFGTATAWIEPEMLQIPWETMKTWLDTTPGLAPYRFNLVDLYRQQSHVLDEEKETLLSYYSQFRSSAQDIYSELSTSDIQFPTIKLSDGKEVKVTNGNYAKELATNPIQDDRKKVFEAHYQVYNDNVNTYAAIYRAVCQKDWAGAQARGYKSTLEATLDTNNVPLEVYENLVNTVKANTQPLQRYEKLRSKALKLEDYHIYDGSIGLTTFSRTYPYKTAQNWAQECVAPLGKDYTAKMKTALAGGWVDVYENDGKRSGAYSANVYGVHPYMLMNYNDTLDNVFTLAHELGHTLHTLYASETQPFSTHGYTIFVAEVGSTFNERLLLDYLLKKSKDPLERIALLQQAIRNINGTFYFQTLLADFELQVHRMIEQGKPVTAKELNKIMSGLYEAYYGDAIAEEKLLPVVWARIPHLYRTPYYVYQYATCFAASAQLYDQVTKGPKKSRKAGLDNYLDLLKSGGNDYPMNQLKKAGADLTKPETILAVVNQLDGLVTLLEKELQKIKK